MAKEIALPDIRIDGGTQQRPVDDAVVMRYKASLQTGAKFPPVSIVFDGKDNWLTDGFHRFHAYRKLGKNYIPAEITNGTKREAVWLSFKANADHGFPRQSGTIKDMLIEKIFPDKEWMLETDKALAGWIGGGVTAKYISQCRIAWQKTKATTTTTTKETSNTQNSGSGNKATTTTEGSPTPVSVKDSTGREVPEHLRKIFNRVPEIKAHIATINALFKTIKEAIAANDILYANCKIESLKADIGNLRRNLRFTKPHAVCRLCGGDVNNKDCRACEGRGFLNESGYMAVPQEMKMAVPKEMK